MKFFYKTIAKYNDPTFSSLYTGCSNMNCKLLSFSVSVCNLLLEVRSPDTSRFPRAAGKPPRANALWGLARPILPQESRGVWTAPRESLTWYTIFHFSKRTPIMVGYFPLIIILSTVQLPGGR